MTKSLTTCIICDRFSIGKEDAKAKENVESSAMKAIRQISCLDIGHLASDLSKDGERCISPHYGHPQWNSCQKYKRVNFGEFVYLYNIAHYLLMLQYFVILTVCFL